MLRSPYHAPGSVHPRPMLQALQQPAVRTEYVDKAPPGAANGIVFSCILPGISYVDIRSDSLHVERSKVAGNTIVIERFLGGVHRHEIGIEHVDAPAAEIGS